MDKQHLAELSALENSYWWHVGKRRLVQSLLAEYAPAPARLVEGGIGSGGNLAAFQRAGYSVGGLDIMPEAIAQGRKHGLPDLHCQDLAEAWPWAAASVDVVVLLDVLEHVAEPAVVLSRVAEVLAPQGRIVLTVPAYPFLYGPWDESLGHYRRYTAAHLRQDAASAGFQPLWLSHWNAFSLPAAIAVRMWQRWRRQPPRSEFPRVTPVVNTAMQGLAAAERWWLGRHRLPLGLSLVGVFSR